MESWKTLVVGYQSFGTGDYQTDVGAAFSPINSTGTWVNETTIFGNTATAGDKVVMFSSAVWNVNTWTFYGFVGGVSQGWGYSGTDPMTWEPDEKVVASFELKQGDTITYQPSDYISGLTVAGQVTDTSAPATWTLEAGEYIGDIMNPYPINTTLADLETFAVAGDKLMVFSSYFWNVVTYTFYGAGNGWGVSTWDETTWEAKDYVETDTTKVVLPSGIGGCFQPTDMNGRTWTVTLGK